MRYVKYLIAILVLTAICFELYNMLYLVPKQAKTAAAVTIINKTLKTVNKVGLIIVKKDIIIDDSDYIGYDVAPLRKEIKLCITGSALIGFDLDNLKIFTDTTRREFSIIGLPDPEILSLDSDISVCNMKEGIFNGYTLAELNKYLDLSKEKLRLAILAEADSISFKYAQTRLNEILTVLDRALGEVGWSLNTPLKDHRD